MSKKQDNEESIEERLKSKPETAYEKLLSEEKTRKIIEGIMREMILEKSEQESKELKKRIRELENELDSNEFADEIVAEINLKETMGRIDKIVELGCKVSELKRELEQAKKAMYGVIASCAYNETISEPPSQAVYEQVWLPELREKGALTKKGITKRAAEVMKDSLEKVKVSDVYELMGIKEKFPQRYEGKYVDELPEKEKEKLVGIYFAFLISDQAEKFIAKEKGKVIKKMEDEFK